MLTRFYLPEAPRLSLSVPPSTSPYPSPGSPFLPPPRLSPHEFANKLSPVEQIMRNMQTKRKSKEEPHDRPPVDSDFTPIIAAPTSPPFTPTPQTFLTQQQPVQVTIPDPLPSDNLATPDKRTQHESLTSSRPAPPSPALSRRASAALSRHSTSSARSRPSSRVTSLSQALPISQQSVQSSNEAQASSSTPAPLRRRSVLTKVRDFAFPQSDDRHFGKGSGVPRANRLLHRNSTSSVSSSSADDNAELEAEDDQRHSSWSPFRWNTLSSHFWGGKSAEQADDSAAGPSRTDFDRNFESSSPGEEESGPEYEDSYDEEYVPPGEEPLLPGTYRALFPFEPEGTAEMALEEDQIIHVIGRGGGVGWAIVETEGGGHALVPESYIELVQAIEMEAQD